MSYLLEEWELKYQMIAEEKNRVEQEKINLQKMNQKLIKILRSKGFSEDQIKEMLEKGFSANE